MPTGRELAVAVVTGAYFWNRRRGRGRYTVAVPAHDGGLVLFDRDQGRVARTYGGGVVDDRYVTLRRRFSAHVAAPSFIVEEGGRVIVEQYVEGIHFLDLSTGAQIDVVRELLRRYTDLVHAEGEGTSERLVAPALSAVESVSLPPAFARLLAGRLVSLREWSRRWPLVPSATDASVKNVIITPAGVPVSIDLGNLRLAPFFSFPIGFIAMARGHVLDAYLNGDLDPELRGLFAAARVDLEAMSDCRGLLLAVRLLLTSHRAASSAGDLDHERLAAGLAQRWAALWSGEPAIRY